VDLTQDVHDVLRLYSSERPGEEREVELALRQLDLRRIGGLEADPVARFLRCLGPRRANRVVIRIECKDRRGVGRILERDAPFAAAHLDDATTGYVHELTDRGDLDAIRIDDERHRVTLTFRR